MSQLIKTVFKDIVMQQHRGLFTTSQLCAEPLRKKKRIDPLVLKQKTERKMRKLEREIRFLEKGPKQLKPIVELDLPPQIIKEIHLRKRNQAEINKSAEYELKTLMSLYSIYISAQEKLLIRSIKSVVGAQKKALKHLKMSSPHLYDASISIDDNLIPYKVDDVKKETPPISGYQPPDGKQQDITKEWKM